MAFFQSNNCAAFTWDDQDTFRGVLIERDGESSRVKEFWQTEKIGNRSRAQMLEQGISPLRISEDTTIIVGGNFSKSCFFDLKMPKISQTDLRSALQFELSKYSPMPVDDVQWAYRVIGKIGTESNLVRVIYFPQSEWDSWVAAASGINIGVDLIIPANAVLWLCFEMASAWGWYTEIWVKPFEFPISNLVMLALFIGGGILVNMTSRRGFIPKTA